MASDVDLGVWRIVAP